MEDKIKKLGMFPLMDPKKEEKLSRVIDLIQFVKDLDVVSKDQNVQILLKEFSKNPENKVIQKALAEHLKPYIIKSNLKPLIFKIPPD